MEIFKFLEQTSTIILLSSYNLGTTICDLRPLIICNDGTNLSVQASKLHYCTPRVDFSAYYTTVEVGYPSVSPPNTWAEYFIDEDWTLENATSSVYGCVPVELVEEFIQDHGGIDWDATIK